jgi:hypothetical protein
MRYRSFFLYPFSRSGRSPDRAGPVAGSGAALSLSKGDRPQQNNLSSYLLLLGGVLLLTSLACQALMGAATTPTVEVAALVTPTARPSATPDPALDTTRPAETGSSTPAALATLVATPTLAAGSQNQGGQSPANTPATPPTGSMGTPAAGNGGAGSNGTNGSPTDGGAASGGSAACPAQGRNLLLQGSFDGPFEPFGFVQELNVPPPWIPWYTDDGAINFRPEYKPADGVNYPNRVRSQPSAQVYFKSFGQFRAGVYQQVLNVPTGARLQFSAYGQGWSCEDFSQCGGGVSYNPANMYMRVGIDPHGNTNPHSRHVVWSDYFNPIDRWEVRCVVTEALHHIVTVYLWSSPDGPRQNQDAYWDDASLVVLP